MKAARKLRRTTTTIRKVWLDAILSGEKQVEYRTLKPYWTRRLKGIKVPFELRLINGMSKSAPEVILLICKVDVGTAPDLSRTAAYHLPIGAIVSAKS